MESCWDYVAQDNVEDIVWATYEEPVGPVLLADFDPVVARERSKGDRRVWLLRASYGGRIIRTNHFTAPNELPLITAQEG